MVTLHAGEAFVAGRSRENARALLDQAAERGEDPSVVRATVGGYIVPESFLDEPEPKPKAAPRKRTTKAAAEKKGS